jgi:hypothetical protein
MTIFVANRANGPVVRIEDFEPEDTLITRPDQEVTIRSLSPSGAEFLLQLISGEPLSNAATVALEASHDFDLASNIASMIEAGVFATLHAGDPR